MAGKDYNAMKPAVMEVFGEHFRPEVINGFRIDGGSLPLEYDYPIDRKIFIDFEPNITEIERKKTSVGH
jgi:hypothetical protein